MQTEASCSLTLCTLILLFLFVYMSPGPNRVYIYREVLCVLTLKRLFLASSILTGAFLQNSILTYCQFQTESFGFSLIFYTLWPLHCHCFNLHVTLIQAYRAYVQLDSSLESDDDVLFILKRPSLILSFFPFVFCRLFFP